MALKARGPPVSNASMTIVPRPSAVPLAGMTVFGPVALRTATALGPRPAHSLVPTPPSVDGPASPDGPPSDGPPVFPLPADGPEPQLQTNPATARPAMTTRRGIAVSACTQAWARAPSRAKPRPSGHSPAGLMKLDWAVKLIWADLSAPVTGQDPGRRYIRRPMAVCSRQRPKGLATSKIRPEDDSAAALPNPALDAGPH